MNSCFSYPMAKVLHRFIFVGKINDSKWWQKRWFPPKKSFEYTKIYTWKCYLLMLCLILFDKTSLVFVRNCPQTHKMTFHVVSITDFERKMDGFGMSKSIKSSTHRLSRLGHFKLFLSFNAFSKVISKVEWIKKNQLTLDLMGQNLALC